MEMHGGFVARANHTGENATRMRTVIIRTMAALARNVRNVLHTGVSSMRIHILLLRVMQAQSSLEGV